jgi:peptidoglycan hydrolase-like protein with peptidoglycan-binding domain
MKRRAKKFLDYFTVQYQWVHFSQGRENTLVEIEAMRSALKEAPLHIGIPISATHAEALLEHNAGFKTFFDSYEPYIKRFEDIYNPIHFSIKALVLPKAIVPKFPIPAKPFSTRLKIGMTNDEVLALQKILMYFGFMNVATGYFGPVTQNAVKEFQEFHGLEPVGEVGIKTMAILNNLSPTPTPPVKSNREILHEAALSCLNKDVTPADIVSDEVACAETVNAIYKKAFGKEIGGGASTYMLYESLKNNPLFVKTNSPSAGDIVISPTGHGNGTLSNGHVGIVGVDNSIMSNNSSTGKFTRNFTFESWRTRYVYRGGFPMAFFTRK